MQRTVQNEQRRVLRLPVPLERDQALLRWRDEDYPARMIDHSARGFGIQLECPIEIKAHEDALLWWDCGASTVRVMSRLDEQNFVRLGLERLEDLELYEDLDPATLLLALRQPRPPLPRGNHAHYVVGILVICGFALAAAAWEILPRGASSVLRAPTAESKESASAGADALAASHRAAQDIGDFSWQFGNDPLKGTIASSLLPRSARQWVAARVQVLNQAARGLVRTMLSLPVGTRQSTAAIQEIAAATTESIKRTAVAAMNNDSLVLSLPRFVEFLQITDQQRREINAIVMAAREATQEVHRRSREIGTFEAMREIENIRSTASEQAMAILSPAQAEQLKVLISGRRGAAADKPATAPPNK